VFRNVDVHHLRAGASGDGGEALNEAEEAEAEEAEAEEAEEGRLLLLDLSLSLPLPLSVCSLRSCLLLI
jgi:hypothetical protein